MAYMVSFFFFYSNRIFRTVRFGKMDAHRTEHISLHFIGDMYSNYADISNAS